MKARIYVTLRNGVLDPAGKAVVGGLHSLGYSEVSDVRIGKFFEVEVADGPNVKARLAEACDKLLANPVIEDYRVELPGET
jgi:phosphoribosylformylglycinamidine synthase subunit PurS